MPKYSKRCNGSGTIQHRKDVRARPWVAFTPANYDDENRKVIREKIGAFATRAEAVAALEECKIHPTTRLGATVGDIYAEWISIHQRNISRQMILGYQAAYKHLASIHQRRIRDLRTADIQACIDRCAEAGLSHSSISKVRILINLLYKYSLENDIVTKNYAEFLKLPKQAKTEKEIFSGPEIEKIKQAAEISTAGAAEVLIMIYTGFRISEFLDLAQFSYDRKAGTLTGGNKTDAGKNRTIPIHPLIRPYVDCLADAGNNTLVADPAGKPYTAKRFREKSLLPAAGAAWYPATDAPCHPPYLCHHASCRQCP